MLDFNINIAVENAGMFVPLTIAASAFVILILLIEFLVVRNDLISEVQLKIIDMIWILTACAGIFIAIFTASERNTDSYFINAQAEIEKSVNESISAIEQARMSCKVGEVPSDYGEYTNKFPRNRLDYPKIVSCAKVDAFAHDAIAKLRLLPNIYKDKYSDVFSALEPIEAIESVEIRKYIRNGLAYPSSDYLISAKIYAIIENVAKEVSDVFWYRQNFYELHRVVDAINPLWWLYSLLVAGVLRVTKSRVEIRQASLKAAASKLSSECSGKTHVNAIVYAILLAFLIASLLVS